MHTPEARAPGGVRHDAAHAAGPKHMVGREVPNEHGPPLGVRRSGACQVFSHQVPDIGRKGQLFVTITLAAHADRARAPVDIVESEPGNFTAPKAEPDQQGQDRQIAAADGGIGIAGRKQTPHPDRARAPWAIPPACGGRPSARRARASVP